MPSSFLAKEKILSLLPKEFSGVIYELGSGWGGLAFGLAKAYPHLRVAAYELSFVPWLWSVCVMKLLRLKNLQIHRKDFLQEDLAPANMVICYLFRKGMKDLEEKLLREMKGIVISNTFALPSCKPEKILHLEDLSSTRIYLYSFGDLRDSLS